MHNNIITPHLPRSVKGEIDLTAHYFLLCIHTCGYCFSELNTSAMWFVLPHEQFISSAEKWLFPSTRLSEHYHMWVFLKLDSYELALGWRTAFCSTGSYSDTVYAKYASRNVVHYQPILCLSALFFTFEHLSHSYWVIIGCSDTNTSAHMLYIQPVQQLNLRVYDHALHNWTCIWSLYCTVCCTDCSAGSLRADPPQWFME